jgi:sugar phosphate isomerase/epimerase
MRFRTAAITDEFSPDLETALRGMAAVGMTGAELRLIAGRNMMDLSDDEVDRVRAAVEAHGMTVISLASPLLKCVLPGAPPLDTRIEHDVFGSPYTYQDQPRLTRRAFEIAERAGAGIIRVFSYWRTVEPERCFPAAAAALHELADEAAKRGVVIGLENEQACNAGTGDEAARLLALVEHPALKALWDPANASILGETPYPDGYRRLPPARIAHVHAKDCIVRDHTPIWGAVGEMGVDWKGQIAALRRDGYSGWISLETHWTGPTGDKFEASTICGRNLESLIANP